MMLLDREAILKAPDKKTIEVDVPEWGKDSKVLLGSMGALDSARINDWLKSKFKKQEPEEKEDEPGKIVTCDSPTPDGENPDEETDPEDSGEETDTEDSDVEIEMMSLTEDAEFMINYLSYSILDPNTKQPCFTLEDIEKLGAKDKRPLRRLFNAALDLNIETKQAIKGAEKNSEATTKDGSGGD